MESRSIIGLLLYASLIVGVSALIVSLGARGARTAAEVLAFEDEADPPTSRVERGLERQARVTEWQPTSHVIETRAIEPPEISAAILAIAMDEAEDADLPPTRMEAQPSAELQAQPSPKPKLKAKPGKPRVAGWIRRAPRTVATRHGAGESTGRIIQRHLLAQM